MYWFFLGSSSLGHAACRAIYTVPTLIFRTRSTLPRPFKKGSACLPCLVLVTMICAAKLCVSFASELPGAGERQNRLISLPFQKPLHPMNRFAHKYGELEKTMLRQSSADTAEFVPGRGEVLRCSKSPVISNGNHAGACPRMNSFEGRLRHALLVLITALFEHRTTSPRPDESAFSFSIRFMPIQPSPMSYPG